MNLPREQEQMVWLIDFEGFNLSHISVKVTRETAHVLQDHYPERLGLAILYNPPKFFEPFWTVCTIHHSIHFFTSFSIERNESVPRMHIFHPLPLYWYTGMLK